MKRLDDSTLETIAETICGQDGAGFAAYSSPSPYRSKPEINNFFSRASVSPRGQSSTRKWYVLESLQAINESPELERVLLRLANPMEYRAASDSLHAVVAHLNGALSLEGLELYLDGVTPRLRTKAAAVVPPKPAFKRELAPDFHKLVSEPVLAGILAFRWEESQRCVEAGAYLAAVVMMGSILEGALLHKVESNIAEANAAKASPKFKDGKPKPIAKWDINGLIDVAHEIGWLQGDMKRFSHALRESRNVVHPYMQRLRNELPDKDTCAICWQVVRAGISDLLASDSNAPGAPQ